MSRLNELIQAFSRTNRILNSIKAFGNIVCFRNLQKRVDAAISLFGALLRMRNLLASFDDFTGNELISERDMQDYLGCRTSVCHGCGKHPVERWM